MKKDFAVNFFCRITFIFGLFVAFERRNRMLKLCQEKANKFYGLLVNETIKLKKNRLSLEVAKTIDIFFYRLWLQKNCFKGLFSNLVHTRDN